MLGSAESEPNTPRNYLRGIPAYVITTDRRTDGQFVVPIGKIYKIFESLFILSGAYLLWNAVSYDGEIFKILHAHASRPCAKHLLGLSLSLPKMTFLNEIPACMQTAAAVTGRSAGWLAGRGQGLCY